MGIFETRLRRACRSGHRAQPTHVGDTPSVSPAHVLLYTTHIPTDPSLTRALATAAPDAPPSPSTKSNPALRPPAPKPQLSVATVVNRAPLLTRTPTPLEHTYHAYQQRLQRALHNPFPADFYFKQGAPLEAKFNMEERARERQAFGRGFSAQAADADADADAKAVEVARGFEEESAKEAPRTHPADVKGDVRSLDRQGERNLYLLLLRKDKDDQFRWMFPESSLHKGELLHEVCLCRTLRCCRVLDLSRCPGCRAGSLLSMRVRHGRVDRQPKSHRRLRVALLTNKPVCAQGLSYPWPS